MGKRVIRVAVLLSVCALVATACLVPARITDRYTFTVDADVVYSSAEIGDGGSFTDLELDLYLPDTSAVAGGERRPLAVLIHGGGFVTGSKANMTATAEDLAGRGWIVAAINYRLAGTDPLPSSRVQALWDAIGGSNASVQEQAAVAAVDDTLSAIDFLHARPDVYDPWTVLWGSSAGAITALIAGYALDDHGIARPPVAGVVALWGGMYGANIGNPFDAPTTDDPSLFIAHGTDDPVVPFSWTEEIDAWADDAGLNHLIIPEEGAGHGWNLFNTNAPNGVSYQQRIVDYLAFSVFAGLPPGGYLIDF